MKKVFLPLIFTFLGFSVFSQVFEFSYGSHSTLLNYGDTIFVEDSANVSELVAYVNVKNTDVSNHDVFCRKDYIYLVSNTNNTFCWAGTCYPENINVSPASLRINAGQTVPDFSAHYIPELNGGVSLIKYTFYDIEGDTGYFYVKFTGLVGVNENELSYSISAPYPNPSNTNTIIDFEITPGTNAIVQIYNICGKIEKEFTLTGMNGILNINVSDLSAGTYMCSLNVNGSIVRTSKLLVTH